MAMAPVEIRRSKSYRLWSIAVPLLGIVALAFYDSVVLGFFVVLGIAVLSSDLKQFVTDPPVVLVLKESGLRIEHGEVESTEIPWQDIEETGVSHVGKRGRSLTIKFRQPEKYLNKFTRALLVFSSFHMSVSVEGLQYSPREVLQLVEDARRAHA
jgi:hypothetical protein